MLELADAVNELLIPIMLDVKLPLVRFRPPMDATEREVSDVLPEPICTISVLPLEVLPLPKIKEPLLSVEVLVLPITMVLLVLPMALACVPIAMVSVPFACALKPKATAFSAVVAVEVFTPMAMEFLPAAPLLSWLLPWVPLSFTLK